MTSDAQPLSRSPLWSRLRQFYDTRGIAAWDGTVPYYITSNPYIANSYANIIIRFIQDTLREGVLQPAMPVYVVELGAGSGTFSFHLLRRLSELRQLLGLGHVRVVHVMADFAQRNLDYWQAHLALRPFIERGELDFAHFDISTDSAIHLVRSGVHLAPEPGHRAANPMVVLANYVFDSIPQDVFRVAGSQFQRALLPAAPPDDGTHGLPEDLTQAKLRWSYSDCNLPYYHEPEFDAVLERRKRQLGAGLFAFPIAALRCIQGLAKVSDSRLCLIMSDIAASQSNRSNLMIQESYFYMPIDFQTIGSYFERRGGSAWHQRAEGDLSTSVFVLGVAPDDLTETGLAIDTYLQEIGHHAITRLFEHLGKTRFALAPETMVTFLAVTRWDPHVFSLAVDQLLQQIRNEAVPAAVVAELATVVDKIADNFYHGPGVPDILFQIGMFLQEIGDYQGALSYYSRSLEQFGRAATTLYNIGVCKHHLRDRNGALSALREVVAMDHGYVMARGWIAQIEYESLSTSPEG